MSVSRPVIAVARASLASGTTVSVFSERLGAVADNLAGVAHRHGFSIPRWMTIFIKDLDNLCDCTAPAPLRFKAAFELYKESFFAAYPSPVTPRL